MISTTKVLKAFNDKLRDLYPNTKIYGIDTKEGYKMPCFNTEIEIKRHFLVSKFIECSYILITCDYLMSEIDVSIQTGVINTILKNFNRYLVVDDRVLHIDDISQDYTGEYNDILTFSIGIIVYENTYDKTITHPIERVDLKLKRKEDGSVIN